MPGTFAYTPATNTVQVTGGTSGSPADFASFAAADRAGAGTSLLAAWAPNSNTKALTYQVRPVELLALLITFTVAGKTAEADYIFITGTDWLGNAQTESIDVSAGNGTYVTTKRFRTINNVDCSDNPAGGGTVWADGTVAVTQPIWGVLWELMSGIAYRASCHIDIGNATTATYFAMENQSLTMDTTNRIRGYSNAVFRMGSWLNDAPAKCSSILFNHNTASVLSNYFYAGCAVYLYGSLISIIGANGNYGDFIVSCAGEIIGCSFYNFQNQKIQFNHAGIIAKRNNHFNASPLITANPNVPMVDIMSGGATAGNFVGQVANAVIDNPDSWGGSYDIRANLYGPVTFINPKFTPSAARIYNTNGGGPSFWDTVVNVKVTDVLGVAINGAAVVLKDKDGNTIFSVTTGADGKITQQQIYVKSWTGASETEFSYTPHTLNITKAGYQEYQDVITIDREMDLEVALRRPPYPLMIQEAVHAVA